MTEVMVHSLVDDSFFTESNFSHINMSKEADMSDGENTRYKKKYGKQKNTQCGKNMESSLGKSIKIVNNSHISGINEPESMNKGNEDRRRADNVSSEDYKILATKTTVINTTYNLIAQSTTREINMKTGVENSSWSNFPDMMADAVDKSRVIVQVLKSDHKSKTQNVVETKTPSGENPSSRSFRDDLCKLLSNSRLPKFEEENRAKDSATTNVINRPKNVSSDRQDSKAYISKGRRKRNFNSYFWNGNGATICDLKCVCGNLRQAKPVTLKYLHFIMFNSMGRCGSGLQVLETKKNITTFCGYPFKRSSEQFRKKLTCLKKIPEPMLVGIHRAVFGKTAFSDRSVLVDQLLDFLLMPRKCSEILKKYEKKNMDVPEEANVALTAMSEEANVALATMSEEANVASTSIAEEANVALKAMPEEDYIALKELASKGPVLSVLLQKLSEEHIKYTTECMNEKQETEAKKHELEAKKHEIEATESLEEDKNVEMDSENKSSDTLPAFILNGPGTKLKSFPKIAYNVRIIPEKSIKLLHYILYGRIEPSMADCRRNILEFNGFSACQQEFAGERKAIIKGLDQKELFELCQILCLRAKTNSREVRIQKILKYLKSPSKPNIRSRNLSHVSSLWPKRNSSKSRLDGFFPKRSYKSFTKKKGSIALKDQSLIKKSSKSKFGKKAPPVQTLSSIPSYSSDETFTSEGIKLRDLKTICSNIECASPSDLTELNDLIFMKTCDESDIHQKILDFTKFKFPVNSFHYDCRKTLLHYMGFCVVRKIAGLLDIENWNRISSPEDLSVNILRFLMEEKEQSLSHSVSHSKSPSSSKSVSVNNVVENSSPSTSTMTVLDKDRVVKPESPQNFKTEFFQEQTNQAITHQKSKVIIQRLTKATVQTQEMCQTDDSTAIQINEGGIFNSNPACISPPEDNSICLRDLIHHPSEQELRDLIHRMVKENLWDFTLGDLVQKVYECYPKVNLTYRESFIKAVARQMVSELRDYAVSAVKDQSFL